ncbi:MAG: cytochrome P450 [Solirubrobacterales bacterium]|nr:cytochrome P450 [Solirubrobacterales bacterium]
MWLATSWEAAARVASEPELFAADMPGSPIDRSFGSPTILTCDGEPHRELRRAVDPKLRPHAVEEYIDELVTPIVDARLDRLHAAGEAELMADFFEPVSVLSLGAVLGLAELDADTLRRWFAALADGATNFERDRAKQAVSDAACAEIDRRLEPVLERLEREPDESTIAHMLHAGMDGGETRPRQAIMPSLKVILLGGMQEPGHGAGSVLYALLRHPEQLAEVVADPERLVAPAIEEGMRWVAPIGTQGRRTTRALELAGANLPADAPVAAVIASANRDEARFPEPDRFDIHRDRGRVATFGFGRHFCSGHAFARAQEGIALRRLLAQLPALELVAGERPELRGWEFRAPRSLRVRWA